MNKAIIMNAGGKRFLMETDVSVVIPPQMELTVSTGYAVPDGMQPVVDLADLKREFDEVTQVISACCNGLFEVIKQIPAPQTLSVEFGVKLAGEAGIPMLTKASGEADFKVCVEWKHG